MFFLINIKILISNDWKSWLVRKLVNMLYYIREDCVKIGGWARGGGFRIGTSVKLNR
jgi:hypothetical protein